MTELNKATVKSMSGKLVQRVLGLFKSDVSLSKSEQQQPEQHRESEPNAKEVETLLSLFGQRSYAEVASSASVLTKKFPQHGFGWKMLGAALTQMGRTAEALVPLQTATTLLPADPGPFYNLGTVFRDMGRLAESAASCRRALQINPDLHQAHNNLGFTLYDLGQLDEAEASYRRALAINPTAIEAIWNLSIVLLATGRYAEAWPNFESRYDPGMYGSIVAAPVNSFPQWRGESLIGKSLLIWPEQGFGDYIQFIRYAKLLKERGVTRLTVLCAQPLKPLLETAEGVDAVITDVPTTATFDYWTFPLSLPMYFGTTLQSIPDSLPYLYARPERLDRWRARLPEAGMKVGLVWKGNPTHRNDANRSLPGLKTLAPLWDIPGVTFVSLQKWQAEDEAGESIADQPLAHLGSDIADFADTAAIVAQLDLVICVDTAITHLSGAVGTPCWTLLPYYGLDWRWLRERSDSPWYPGTMRLFRQTVPGDWTETIQAVTTALKEKQAGVVSKR